MARPYVLLSAAMSVDGYLDDASPRRLLLSSAEDFDAVDELRAGVDAILVGAGTLRADNPRLLVRSAQRRRERVARGLPESPVKVVISGSGALDPDAAFFAAGPAERLVYLPTRAVQAAAERLSGRAEVRDAGDPLDVHALLADLGSRGVRRLLVEGGGTVHTLFLIADVVDELRVAMAPFFVGDPAAPRLVGPGAFPQSPARPMRLVNTENVGGTAVLCFRVDGPRR